MRLWKGYSWSNPKAWVSLISILLPDCIKSKKWRMWEYRDLYRCARCMWELEDAYFTIKHLMWTYTLLENISKIRKSS